MALGHSLRLIMAPPHRAGRPFIIAGTAFCLLGGLVLGAWAFWLGLFFASFCLFFFRDPARVAPARPGLVLAPADGKVVSVDPAVPPAELGLGTEPRWRVGIFLSVVDVHVNRVPADGRVTRIVYRPGAFLNASLDKASEDNERNAIALRLPDGRALAVVQIAGLIARRILCDIREGQDVQAGERFGIIRFGSRTDVYLPEGVRPLVAEGQTMTGGETVIAELAPARVSGAQAPGAQTPAVPV
jgi:phosphatidylserine decarboxylase